MKHTGSGKSEGGGLFLTGFMGSGKSTLGPLLAKPLALPFVDLDQHIEFETRTTISQLFDRRGEAGFRLLEARTLREIPSPAVVALGGGAFMTESVRNYVAEQGRSVFVDWPFSVLWGRVAGDSTRPLACNAKDLEDLYHRRRPVYEKADLIWRSAPPHRESAAEIAKQILTMLQD